MKSAAKTNGPLYKKQAQNVCFGKGSYTLNPESFHGQGDPDALCEVAIGDQVLVPLLHSTRFWTFKVGLGSRF